MVGDDSNLFLDYGIKGRKKLGRNDRSDRNFGAGRYPTREILAEFNFTANLSAIRSILNTSSPARSLGDVIEHDYSSKVNLIGNKKKNKKTKGKKMDCLLCNTKQELPEYRFCNTNCQYLHWKLFEWSRQMNIKIDKDLFIQWQNDEIVHVKDMDGPALEARIKELEEMEFTLAKQQYEVKAKAMITARTLEEKSGRKGIQTEIKKHRDALVDPTFTVNFDTGTAKVKAAAPKKDKKDTFAALGIDMDVLKAHVLKVAKENKAKEESK